MPLSDGGAAAEYLNPGTDDIDRQLETQMKGRKARPKEKAAMVALTAAPEKLYGDAWKEIIGKA